MPAMYFIFIIQLNILGLSYTYLQEPAKANEKLLSTSFFRSVDARNALSVTLLCQNLLRVYKMIDDMIRLFKWVQQFREFTRFPHGLYTIFHNLCIHNITF
jgi:hypothetical protein